MINFKAFKALHTKEENIAHFPIYTPDLYTEEEITKKLKERNISSYIDIVRPTFFRGESPLKNRFKKVSKRFEEYSKDLIKDPESIYIYEQKKPNGIISRGVIGLIAINNYTEGFVRGHESVIETKKDIATLFLDIVKIQSQPVLLTYDESSKLEVLMDLEMKSNSHLHFTDEYEISHKLWKVDNRLKISQFKNTIESFPALYIVDGHHRMKSSLEYYNKVKSKNKNKNKNILDPSEYVMSLIVPNNMLRFYAYNQLIKDINGMRKEELLSRLEENFIINFKNKEPYFPSHKHHICMYMEGEFYGLYIKHELRGNPDGLGNLDTYLFDQLLLKPVLGIDIHEDDSKVDFIKGSSDIQGIINMKERVDNENYAVGFGFYSMNFNDMKLVADLGHTLPPKSTYIEPKLLSGLLIYDMNK